MAVALDTETLETQGNEANIAPLDTNLHEYYFGIRMYLTYENEDPLPRDVLNLYSPSADTSNILAYCFNSATIRSNTPSYNQAKPLSHAHPNYSEDYLTHLERCISDRYVPDWVIATPDRSETSDFDSVFVPFLGVLLARRGTLILGDNGDLEEKIYTENGLVKISPTRYGLSFWKWHLAYR